MNAEGWVRLDVWKGSKLVRQVDSAIFLRGDGRTDFIVEVGEKGAKEYITLTGNSSDVTEHGRYRAIRAENSVLGTYKFGDKHFETVKKAYKLAIRRAA